MTLLDELKRAKARRSKKKAKKKTAKRRKKATKKRPAKKRAKKRTKKRAKRVQSFGAMMRQGGKRKLNAAKTRTRIKNLYKQGELAQANKLRAKLKAAGYEYKA
jgi:hypothetical protein